MKAHIKEVTTQNATSRIHVLTLVKLNLHLCLSRGMKHLFFALGLLIVSLLSAKGQTTTTFTVTLGAAANWSTATWVKSGGTSNASYPGQTGYAGENAGDIHDVAIYTSNATARTLTLDVPISSHARNITIYNSPGVATLALAAQTLSMSGTLSGSGKLTITTGTLNIDGDNALSGTFTCGTSTVNYTSTGAQIVKATTYNNLSLSGSGTKTITPTTTIVNAILSMNGSATASALPAYGASASLQYNGTAAQTSGAELPTTIPNLIINNSAGVTLTSDISVGSKLTLTNGILSMGGHTLTITSSAATAVSGGGSTSFVDGSLACTLTTGTTYNFQIGSASCGYHPINLSNFTGTVGTVLKATFYCSGATTGDGTTLPSPNGMNWDLQYVSGSFTSATVALNGTEIVNTTYLGKASAQAGTYTKVTTATASLGVITATGIGPITTDLWLATSNSNTYYSYQSGNWTASGFTWTLDPSGTLQIGSGIPSNFDAVYILPGRTVSLPSDINTNGLNISIQDGGFLDLSTYQFTNTINSLSGQGTLMLASPNFPTVTTNSFVTSSGGTTQYYNGGSFTLPTTQSTYNNLTIYLSAPSYTATQLSNLTLNGDLVIKQGIFRINDNSSTTALTLNVFGNTLINPTGQIAVGQGITNGTIGAVTTGNYYNQFHSVNLYGDFTNNGTVKFTNLTYPLYNAFPPTTVGTTCGAANVSFEGATSNTITCNGVTIFYNLIVSKGIDQTYQLTINSTAYPNFQLYGANTLSVDGSVTSTPSLRKALWIQSGTLVLQGYLIIPSLTEGTATNADYFIPLTGALVVDGADVIIQTTADDYREVNLAYGVSGGTGLVNGISQGGNSATYIFGTLQMLNGFWSTKESGGIITSSIASGQFIINGGSVDTKQFISLNGSSSAYTQTAGTLILRGLFQRTPIAYSTMANLSDISTASLNTARAVNGITAGYGSFALENTSNIFTMSGGTILIYDVSESVNQKAFDVYSSSANVNVTGGTLDIRPTSGTVLANPSTYYIYTTAPMGYLTINQVSGSASVQLNTNPLTLLNDFSLNTGTFIANNLNLTVGGNFSLQSGTTYTPGTNTTILNGNGTQTFSVNLASALTLNNFTISKPAGSIVNLSGSQTSLNINGNFSLQSASLNDNGDYIYVLGSIYNSGVHTGTGKISAKGTAIQTIDGNGVFQNLELNNTNAAAAPVSLVANMTVNGKLTFSQDKLFNIGVYKLSLGPVATIINYSSLRYIQTSGNSGDGGMSKVYASTTPFTFPIGGPSTSHVGVPKYTPATIGLSSAPTTYGTITVVPVGYEHPATTVNSQSLTYFWRVRSSDFTGIVPSSVTHSFTYDQTDATSETNYIPTFYNRTAYTWNNGTSGNINTTSNTFTDWATSSSVIDADYTAGDNSSGGGAFGLPKKFFSRQSGLWSASTTWSFTNNSGTANTGGAVPSINDIVVIGGQDSVYLSTNSTVANTDVRSCASLQIEVGSALDIGYNYNCNFGMVLSHPNGNGNFRFTTSYTDQSTFTFPLGDFTDFNVNLGTTELYSTNPTSGTTYWLPNGTTSYGNLILSPLGGSNIIFANNNLTIYGNLITRGQNADSWFCPGWNVPYPNAPTVAIAKTVTVQGSMYIQGGALIWYGNGSTTQKFIVNNDVVVSPSASLYNYDGSSGSISIGRSLINNADGTTHSGTSTPCKFDGTNLPVTFFGNSNASITSTSGTPATTFSTVTINKGNSQSTTLTCNIAGTLTTPADNWLTLLNGTLIYNRTGNFNISTVTNFTIPSTAGLTINTGSNVYIANTATNNQTLFLNGNLTVLNGNVYIGPTGNTANNADIEYSGSGASAINVQGGGLYVNGQIRRPLATTNGILSYTQSGGTVNINGNNPLSTNLTKAKLEVLNSGSAFNMSGGTLTITKGNGTSYGDLFLRPSSSSVTGGTIVLSNSSASVMGFALESSVALNNLSVTAPTAVTTTSLLVSPLVLNGNLTIGTTKSVLNTNNLNVTINGNLVNNGTYNYGTNQTSFTGSAQTISGASTTNFYDLNVSPSTSLTAGSSFTVNDILTIGNGVLILGANKATVYNNFINNGSYTATNAIGSGVSLRGTAVQQQISGNGAFGMLELNNPLGAVSLNDITLTGNFGLTLGILDISSNQLILSINSSILGSSFSATKMIKTDGVASSLGLTKFFSSGASSFTYPLGVTGKYTPATINITSNTSAGSIRILPVNAYHTTVLDPNNVLHYYWKVQSSGISSLGGSLTFNYLTSDVFGTENLYYGAYLANPGDYWYKGFSVTTATNVITFPLSNSYNISADYTAGLNVAIPDQVPTYRSNNDGNWTDNTIWTPVGSSPVCPSGGPNGCIVIINNVVSTNTSNYCTAYRTTINNTLKIMAPTYGHNLGTVDGAGTLYLQTGNLPGGDYTAFIDCANNGTLEYGGSGTYTNIASLYDQVPNLVFSGTGTRVLYNKDLTICKRLVINGPTLDNSVNNKKLYIDGTMEIYGTGGFLSGTGNAPAATVTFSGVNAQTVGGPLGNFYGTCAFNNLEISNSAGLSIGNGGLIEVNNNLLLSNGNITTTSANQLKINNTSNTAVIPSGGSSSSYVSGPLIKQIVNGDNFLFPLGKGSVYGHNFTLTSNAGTNAYWTAEYFTPNSNTNLTSPLSDITSSEYWAVNSTTNYNASVDIAWDNLSGLVPAVTQNGMSDMRVAEFNSGTNKWVQVGTSATAVANGNLYVGDVTSTTPVSITSTPKNYTIASITNAKPYAHFTSSANVCGSAGVTLTFTSYPLNPISLPYQINYSISGVAQTTLTVNSLPYTLPTPSAGTYLLTGFSYKNSGGIQTSGAVTNTNVVDYASPTVANAGPNQSLCSSSGTTLAGNPPSPYTGLWSITSGNGGTFGNNTTPSSTFNGILGNSYSLSWTISNGTCKSSSNTLISFLVAPAMPSSFIATVPTACNVSTANIYTVPAITGNTYNWTYSGTGATINSSSTNIASVDFSSTATGGTLSVTATNACGTSPARSVSLLVNPRGSWLGASSTDWFDTNNWSCPGLPLSSSTVSIPSSATNQPIIGANGAVAGSITIQNGASLSLLNTYNLDVYNNWQNNGTLNAASNSTVSFKGTSTISGTSTNTFGNVAISGTLTGPASSGINITGNWTNIGTFTHNNGTVNFNGTTLQTITNTNGEQFNNLSLGNPIEIDIAPTTSLTVNGATTLSGNLVLKSSAAGTANLLNIGNITQTGTASVERYTAGTAFHYIASPMSATPSSNFNDMVSGPINRNFLIYDESLSSATFNDNWLNGWIPQLTAAAMTKGKGYAFYYDGDRTYSFNGGILNGATPATAITIPVTYTTHTWSSTVTTNNRIADGWNLIGNPYPCGLDANTFISANSGAINGSLYFWDEATPYTSWNINGTDYACWNGAGTTGTGSGSFVPNGKISIGQGFFVKAKSGGTGSVSFTSNMRTVSPQHFFKGGKIIQRAMISVVNPQKEHNETLIAFLDDATDGFDDLYDGIKMKGNKNLALYSKLDGRDYAIQSFPSLAPDDTKTVNIGIDALVDGNYKFNLNRIEQIDPAIHVYLIDKALNKKTDLRKTSVYECYLTSGTYNTRFKVVFTNKDLEVEPLQEDPQMKVYASNHKVFVELPTEANASQVRIFDISGREVYHGTYQDLYQIIIPMDDKSGIYMVEVKYNGASKTTKVFLER